MDSVMSKKKTPASKSKTAAKTEPETKVEAAEIKEEDRAEEKPKPAPKVEKPVEAVAKAPAPKPAAPAAPPVVKIGLKEACRRFLPKFRDYQWPSVEHYAKSMGFKEPNTVEKCKELLRGWGAKKILD
jgi:hypothetical protein